MPTSQIDFTYTLIDPWSGGPVWMRVQPMKTPRPARYAPYDPPDRADDGEAAPGRAWVDDDGRVVVPTLRDELFEEDIRRRVAGRAEQHPQYRPLVAIGDAGGEPVFVPQTSAAP